MDIQDLPLKLLIKIFHYLPFKERIRNARLSKLFQAVFETSINEITELKINAKFAAYALTGGLKPFLAKYSSRRIIVESAEQRNIYDVERLNKIDWP